MYFTLVLDNYTEVHKILKQNWLWTNGAMRLHWRILKTARNCNVRFNFAFTINVEIISKDKFQAKNRTKRSSATAVGAEDKLFPFSFFFTVPWNFANVQQKLARARCAS